MKWIGRLLNIGRTGRLNREIEREQAFHIAEAADALRAAGWSDEAAEREARRRFGNATYQREATRDADIVVWADSFIRDVRHSFRALVRAPLFATVAVLSLALGIGANTAVFSLIEAVVLRPLPVPEPEALVAIGMGGEEDLSPPFTNPLWEQLRDRQSGMSAVAAFGEVQLYAPGPEGPRPLRTGIVSGDYFRLFGVSPAAGRLLTARDDVRGCRPLAVLASGFWRREYGGAPGVVGRTLTLEGVPFEVVGVAAAGFDGPEVGREVDVYMPLCAEAAVRGDRSRLDARSSWWLRVMGRRAEGVTLPQLNARLAAIAPAAYGATVPERYGEEARDRYVEGTFSATAASTGLSSVRERFGDALLMLMAAVALVLLIACANVANLLLARAKARERELAVRAAIGAGRGRLGRQMLTESLLLAGLGAVAGLVVARLGAAGLVALIRTEDQGLALDLSLNAPVLMFTTAVAVLTVLMFGLVPAWRAARVDPQTTMSGHGRGIAQGHSRLTLGKALVAGQVALSLVLLSGAGLLVGSLRNLVTLDPGFTAEGVVIAEVDLGSAGLDDDAVSTAMDEMLDRLRGIAGVRSASMSFLTPVGRSMWNEQIVVEGFSPASERDDVVWFNEVSPAYFETLGTRILSGRDFDASDVAGGPRTALVSESVARKFFDGDAMGETLRTRSGDDLSEPYTVIGIVEDTKYASLREEETETVFVARAQAGAGYPFGAFALRTDGSPAALYPAIRRAAAEVHPAARLRLTTLSDQLARSVQRERMLAVLSGLFAAVALALAVLGLYGVMVYAVARRRKEIGVRIALGADRARVLGMVLRDTTLVLSAGLTAGLLGALLAGRLVESFLYRLTPGDPLVLGGAAALLAAVALTAGAIPALRAARLDPTVALREE